MRSVSKPQKTSFRLNQTGPRATQPSTPPSNMRTTGPQGTPGGKTASRKPGTAGRMYQPGQEVYLWALVAIELFLTGAFRRYFRRFHGG